MILLITRLWPTAERPSLGPFVRDRARGVEALRVIRPRRPRMAWPLLYAQLLFDALAARGPIRGVEAHVVFPTGLIGWVVARVRGVPLLVYSHGSDVRTLHRRPWPVRWLSRFVVRHADRVVTNSDDTAANLRAMGVEPIIAPPGVDLRRFRPTPRPSERRVLYLGGANPVKGYEIAQRHADTLIGPWLRESHDVPQLLAEHDVLLVPSRAEALGMVAIEAIASGRWVVANDVGGLRRVITDGVNGTLVRDGDFATALGSVPDYDPEAVARTAEPFSLERHQAEMARIWEDLLDG